MSNHVEMEYGVGREKLLEKLKAFDFDNFPVTHLGLIRNNDTAPVAAIGYYHRLDGVIEEAGFPPLSLAQVVDHFYSKMDQILETSPPSQIIHHEKGWGVYSQPLGDEHGQLVSIYPRWIMVTQQRKEIDHREPVSDS